MSIHVNVPDFIEAEYLPEHWVTSAKLFRDNSLECADKLGPCNLDLEDIAEASASN